MLHSSRISFLIFQRPVIAFEHSDEKSEGQERVSAQLEEPHVVMLAQRPATAR